MGSPGLAQLIDLEVQLRADAELPPEELHARDGAIGQRIQADTLDDRTATLRWLSELRSRGGPGTLAEQRRHQVSAGLVVVGAALGALSVGGWLATANRFPVNVVYFWPVFVGSQIALALGFWLALLPGKVFALVPLLAGFHSLLRTLAGALPRLLARVLARLSPSTHERFSDSLGELGQLDWLYGRLRFWLWVQMTQLFAVAFNIGALGAFVLIPSIDDPAFGWRSRLLDAHQIEAATAAIATPWRAIWPQALPTSEVVAATFYSSVATRYETDRADAGAGDDRDAAERPWAAWWPFLFASMGCYGLAPRVLYLGIAALGVRRARAGVSFDRIEIRRLAERLRWPITQTAGIGDESSGAWPESENDRRIAAWPRPTRARALRWVGVDVEDEPLSRALLERFGARPSAVHPVGDVEGEGDAAALATLSSADRDEAVYVIVESWEPPVGDQLDLLDAVRERAGRERPVLVVLHGRSEDGRSAPPEPRHQAIWQKAIARRGDPRLFVAALMPAGNEETT